MIPYGRQSISEADIAAVVAVLRSDFLTQGPVVPAFEAGVASYCGARHAVAVNSATSALHLACRALDVGTDDWVWTSPITFVASANCALYCGARIDFVDIDPLTYNLSVGSLEDKLERAERDGRLPKVVIPVHLCGQACDMAAIRRLSLRYGFRVIEDASHAIGGRYLDGPIGDGRFSDVTVFSFHPVKIITTAEGGMAVTNDQELARRMRLLRSHGITRDPLEMVSEPDGPWSYEQIELGYNYRMTDLQAALGLSQLRRITEFVSKRAEIAAEYDVLLADLPVRTPWQHPNVESARHLYVIRLALADIPVTHREVFDRLRAAGVGVNLHYIPVYRQPYYRQVGRPAALCPEADRYYAEAISLPIFPALSGPDQRRVVDAVQSACGR